MGRSWRRVRTGPGATRECCSRTPAAIASAEVLRGYPARWRCGMAGTGPPRPGFVHQNRAPLWEPVDGLAVWCVSLIEGGCAHVTNDRLFTAGRSRSNDRGRQAAGDQNSPGALHDSHGHLSLWPDDPIPDTVVAPGHHAIRINSSHCCEPALPARVERPQPIFAMHDRSSLVLGRPGADRKP